VCVLSNTSSADCADDTRWIDEQLGNITASRTYVVEPDAAKRKRCRGQHRLSTWHPSLRMRLSSDSTLEVHCAARASLPGCCRG
jgi:hypothetical protein